MPLTTILAAIALLACFLAGAVYAPIDYERNQRAAELEMKRRLLNKFPAVDLAQLATPVQGDDQ